MLASTSMYAVSVFIGRTASFLLFPVYTRFLSPADYGVLELLDLTLYVYGTLLGMRIGEALVYRWSASGDDRQRETTVATAYWGAVLLGILSLLPGWLLSERLSLIVFGTGAYRGGFILMFTAFAASLPVEVGLALARARDRSIHYFYFSLSRLVLGASLNVFFLAVLHWKYEAMLWGNLIASMAISAASLAYISAQGCRWGSFRFGEFRKLLAYGAPLGLGGLGMLLIHYGDRFFLRKHVSLGEIGIYALAYKIGMLVTNLQTPFDIYWRSQMFEVVRRQDGARVYVRVCTYLALTLMAFTVFLIGFSTPLLRVLAGPDFRSAAQYVPWIAFAYVIRTIGGHFRNAFLLEGATHMDAAIVWVGALVCLGGYAWLIPRYTLWGAILATLIAFGVMLAAGFWQAQRVRRFDFEYRRLAIVFAAALPAALASWWYQPSGMLLQLAFGAVLFSSYLVLLALARFPDEDERQLLRQLRARFFAFLAAAARRTGA